METCQRKVNAYSVSRSVYLMGLFDWKLVKEDKKENAPSILTFERDENVPYYQEMVQVEKETSPHLMPFWPIIAVVALAFVTMTTYLILFLALKNTTDIKQYFLAFFIPAALLLLVDVLLFYLRSKQLMKYLQNEDAVVQNAEEKMKQIKEKYGK